MSVMLLICPKCGATEVQSAGGGQYRCARCDILLELRPLADAAAAYCLQCHAIVLSNAPYCHQCGAEVQTLHVTRACPICAKTIPVAGVFCPYCRAQLDLPKEIGCPACGQSIAPTVTLCPHCGADIEGFLAPLRLQIPIALRPCPSCSELVPVASSFCLHCRAPIVLPQDSGARQWVDCPACWRTVVPEAGVCPYCGAEIVAGSRLSERAGKVRGTASSRPRRSPRTSSAAISARLLLVMGTVFLFLLLLTMIMLLSLLRGGGL